MRMHQIGTIIHFLTFFFSCVPNIDTPYIRRRYELCSVRHTYPILQLPSMASQYATAFWLWILSQQRLLNTLHITNYHITFNSDMGIKLTDPSEINQCFHSYYSKLYASESSHDESLLNSFFSTINTSKIDEEIVADLDSCFTSKEFIAATRSMQSGKSPGPDGYLNEFLKKICYSTCSHTSCSLWRIPYLRLTTWNDEASSHLINSQKDKNLLECSSFQPTSLLNVDSKLLTKMLARWLETVLPLVIADDQTGFIKNRHSFTNICRLMNILNNPALPNTPEILLSLDAEKAFDQVAWDYFLYTLQKFGFGAKFISWIHVLYSFPLAAIRTNNNLSAFFH